MSKLEPLLDWLFVRQRFGMKPGLERVRALLKRSGNAGPPFRIILVAGTNGKGSTAATLASILQAAGHTTGLFTSPHLTHFAERFQVSGKTLDDAVIAEELNRLKPQAEAIGATFFEIVTVLAVALFRRAGVDFAVMEVGLGGRFDATNALEPALSLITNIALDHTDVLGDTPEAIAREKAGILRPDIPALTAAEGAALGVIHEEAARLGSPLEVVSVLNLDNEHLGWQGTRLGFERPELSVSVHTPLLGRHQALNVALAVRAAQRLGVDTRAIQVGVRMTHWPGRLEPLTYQKRRILLDGAHNPAAALALEQALSDIAAHDVTLVVGMVKDKDVRDVLAIFKRFAKRVIVTKAVLSPRSSKPETLAEHFEAATVAQTPAEALAIGLTLTPPDGVIVVAGSLYLIGEMRPLILGDEVEDRERWQ